MGKVTFFFALSVRLLFAGSLRAMQICLILTMFFLLSARVLSQDMVDLYEPQLPNSYKAKVMKSSAIRQSLNQRLKYFGALDPDLIYFYIRSLSVSKQKGANKSPSDSLFAILSNLQNEAKRLRNEWVEKQKKMVRRSAYAPVKKRRLIAELNKLRQRPQRSKNRAYKSHDDVNKIKFFSYIYLSRKKGLRFDPNVDYGEKIQEESGRLVHSLKRDYASIISQPKGNTHIEDLATEHLYLFRDSYLLRRVAETDFYYYEYVERSVRNTFVNHGYFFIEASYLPVDMLHESSVALSEFAADTPSGIDDILQHFRQETQSKYAISIGYKYLLSKKYTAFSSFFLRAGIYIDSKESVQLETPIKLIIFDPEIPGGRKVAVTQSDSRYWAMFSQIDVPVYYFFKWLEVQAGINYLYQNSNVGLILTEEPNIVLGQTESGAQNHVLSSRISLKVALIPRVELRAAFQYPFFASSHDIDPTFSISTEIKVF